MANEYFSRTPSVASNRRTFTFSCWLKRIKIGTGGANRNDIFTAGNTASVGAGGFHFWFIDDNLRIESDGGSIKVVSSAAYRDTSQAYHLVCRVDTTQSDANNRLRMYVNGSLVSLSTNSQPSQNYQYQINNTTPHYIGVGNDDNVLSYYTGGVMSDAFFVDGQSLDASSFGKTNSNGQWTPKHPEGIKAAVIASGGFGTNGFYLPFGSNIGYDQSGLGNNYSANNFDLNGDFKSKDTISNNFCMLNTLSFFSERTISEGGLRISGGNDGMGTIGVRSGKWYWEMKRTNTGVTPHTGIAAYWGNSGADSILSNAGIIQCRDDYGSSVSNGTFREAYGITNLSSELGTRQNWSNNDILSFQLDLDSSPKSFKIFKNSSTGTPMLHRTFDFNASHDIYQFCRNNSGSETLYNFGQGTFVTSNSNNGYNDSNGKGVFQYEPPSGFLALCEDNLSDSSGAAANPREHVKVITFTGDGTAARAITGVGFKPDLVMIRNRDVGYYTQLHDSVRGASAGAIYTGTNTLTQDSSYPISSFDNDGFTTKNASGTGSQNGSGERMVAWCWKASGTTTSNTNGSITSTVSVNASAGFSIVKYNASSSAATVGHGLSSAPQFIILRGGYDSQTYNFDVYHKDIGPTKRLLLNSTSTAETTSGPWNNTSPTSTVIHQGSGWYANGVNNIAYCWTEIPGYSKFGTYVYSNSTDGSYVHLGFKPAIILIKNTDNVEQWYIVDNARNTINGTQTAFLQMGTNTESSSNSSATDSNIDFLANGFKLRDLGSATNGEVTYGSRNYIYAAWAESPFDFANAR
jgi:hypothetical protein